MSFLLSFTLLGTLVGFGSVVGCSVVGSMVVGSPVAGFVVETVVACVGSVVVIVVDSTIEEVGFSDGTSEVNPTTIF